MQDAPLPWRLRDETLPGSDGSGAVCRSVSSKSKQAVKPFSPYFSLFWRFFAFFSVQIAPCESQGFLFECGKSLCC